MYKSNSAKYAGRQIGVLSAHLNSEVQRGWLRAEICGDQLYRYLRLSLGLTDRSAAGHEFRPKACRSVAGGSSFYTYISRQSP